MNLKHSFLIAGSLIFSIFIGHSQTAQKPLKITSFKAVDVEVEDDLFKRSLVTLVNEISVTNREYTIIEGEASISKIGKYDVVEFKDNSPVKVRVVVADPQLGCDTAYLRCQAETPTIDVSKKYYLCQKEWSTVTTTIAKPISKNPAMAFAENNPSLPNVLIIGTSISIGYTPYVREMLSGVANTYRIPENSNSTEVAMAKIDFWLGEMKWDVIHVNFGLHDLKYTFGDKEQDVPPALYKSNLKKLLARMCQTGAKVIWANTSYYPEKCVPRRDVGDDLLYNNLALEVLKEFPQIVIDDQYSLTKANPQNQQPNNVHFKPEGYKQQGAQASEIIKSVL